MKKTFNASRTAFCATLIFMAAGAVTNVSSQPINSLEGFGTVPNETTPSIDSTKQLLNGETVADQNLTSTEIDKSVILIKDNASAKLLKSIINKASGNSSNGGQSNFYGLNAAVVAQDGSTLTLQDVTVTSNADGANAVFSTGEGTLITIKNITIRTSDNSSRGLDATYGGKIVADKVDIETNGAHCAAFATDRGEGTVIANGGKASTKGEGSPIIYSTGDICVKNLEGSSTGSEIAVIEGKNSILIEKSNLSGGAKKDGSAAVMLYQSMSGDANLGTSSFTANDSILRSNANGPFFYVTNTNAKVYLTGTKLEGSYSELIHASGNNSERGWGKKGANGGTLEFNATKQLLTGDVYCDAISSVKLNLTNGSKLKGAINNKNEGTVDLTLDKKSVLALTADSYVNVFIDKDTKLKNIKSNGYTLYYNKKASENSWLKGAIITLSDGGRLVGIDMEVKKVSAESNFNGKEKGRMGPPPMDQNGGDAKQMPEPVKLTATVKLVGSGDDESLALVTADGKEYAVVLMMHGGEAPHGNPPEAGKGDAPKGNPPKENPPKGKAPQGKPGEDAGQGGLTLEEAKKYVGKTVIVTGCIMPPSEEPMRGAPAGEKPEVKDDGSGKALEDGKAPEKAPVMPQVKPLKDGVFIVFNAEVK